MTKLEQAARQALEAIGECSPNKALVHAAYALREALAEQEKPLYRKVLREMLDAHEQAEQDLDTCPGCGGIADNGHDREFPPNPYYCTKCTEQAEQEPVGEMIDKAGYKGAAWYLEPPATGTKLYAAHVRTKDLTDDEIMKINVDTAGIVPTCDRQFHFARAVIAADREKNK